MEANRPYLRVYGKAFDVDKFLEDFGPIHPDVVWHEGEPNPIGGRPDVSSGFIWYLTDQDSEYWKQETNLERFLHEHYIGLSSLHGEANCEAEIILYNSANLPYSDMVHLDASLMGMLAGLGFSLEIRNLLPENFQWNDPD